MEDPKVAEFVNSFERIRERTMRLAACVPPDRVDWTFKEGRFTLGDLLRHIVAAERWMWAENVQGRPSAYPGHGRELAADYDAILAYMTRMHGEAMAVFRSLTDADLGKKCPTPGGIELRIGKWLQLMAEHEIHHRGQIYVYLALLDVKTPPLYGLTEQEVKQRSLREPAPAADSQI